MKKEKFKKRYVLGEGYPWMNGTKNYIDVSLCCEPIGVTKKELKWFDELWSDKIPRYRLVLERVDD